jgi:hypothetical protein
MAGRRRLLLLEPVPGTEPVHFRYRKSPLDDPFTERLLEAAASVPSRRNPKGSGHVYIALLEGASPEVPFSLYVGSTGLGPKERYRNHLKGIKGGRKWIRKHGLGLLPKVYARFNPMLGRDKEPVELALAEALRAAGFKVYGPSPKTRH